MTSTPVLTKDHETGTNTKPRKTVEQIREDIKRYHEEREEERDSQKDNPQVDALLRLQEVMAEGKLDSMSAAKKLGGIIDEMLSSPLVLKVSPETLKYIDTTTYRTCLAQPCGMLGLRDAKDRAVQMIQALSFLLYLMDTPEEIEHSRDRVIKVLSDALFWVCEYMDEADAREHMAPEDAALCALAGESFYRFRNKL